MELVHGTLRTSGQLRICLHKEGWLFGYEGECLIFHVVTYGSPILSGLILLYEHKAARSRSKGLVWVHPILALRCLGLLT